VLVGFGFSPQYFNFMCGPYSGKRLTQDMLYAWSKLPVNVKNIVHSVFIQRSKHEVINVNYHMASQHICISFVSHKKSFEFEFYSFLVVSS
jgi:hypothetical protein